MKSASEQSAALSESECLRYQRQLSLPDFAETGQQALKSASVLCVGAGGLGAPALTYLAAATREHATRLYRRDLADSLDAASVRAVGAWPEAEAGLQMAHDVPGGLSGEERRALFEAHVAALGVPRDAPKGAADLELGRVASPGSKTKVCVVNLLIF